MFCGHGEVDNGEGSPLMALHVTGAALTAAWVAEKSRAASLHLGIEGERRRGERREN